MSARKIDLNLHDTSIGIWQDDPYDPSFRTEIYEGVLKLLKRRGWKITADPNVIKHFRCLSKSHRLAERGDLRAAIQIGGRHIEVEFWAETWPIDNPNGRRHDFNKRERLGFLDRLRVDLETSHIRAWLVERAEVSEKHRDYLSCGLGPGEITADEYVRRRWDASGHCDKTLGRPVSDSSYNVTGRDRGRIEHGARVWFVDRKGRIGAGTALYDLNNCWMVQVGRYTIHHTYTGEIFTSAPADLRTKRNERARRGCLERELARAIQADNFTRAKTLRRILFGDEPTFRIWSRKNDCYYASNCAGYTSDTVFAGRYTRQEAEAEVLRVPHILEMVTSDGRHIRAEAISAARAA